jgi:hypothetical protein
MSGAWSVSPGDSRTRLNKTKWPRHTNPKYCADSARVLHQSLERVGRSHGAMYSIHCIDLQIIPNRYTTFIGIAPARVEVSVMSTTLRVRRRTIFSPEGMRVGRTL